EVVPGDRAAGRDGVRFEVEVRAERVAGVADVAERLPLGDAGTLRDGRGGHVGVEGVGVPSGDAHGAVGDDDVVAEPVGIVDCYGRSVRGAGDRVARRSLAASEVDAFVEAARARPVLTGDAAERERPDETRGRGTAGLSL